MDIQEHTSQIMEDFGGIAAKISHSNFSVDDRFDERLDEYDTTEFLQFMDAKFEQLKNKLPIKKDRPVPEIQVCSLFFYECKKNFPDIWAMTIFDELSARFEFSPEVLFKNLAKPLQLRLKKELSKRIPLDKYENKVRKESMNRNGGAFQPRFS